MLLLVVTYCENQAPPIIRVNDPSNDFFVSYSELFAKYSEWILAKPLIDETITDILMQNVDDWFLGKTIKVQCPMKQMLAQSIVTIYNENSLQCEYPYPSLNFSRNPGVRTPL